MDQLNWFSEMLPYKYIIDASSIFSQNLGEHHARTVNVSLWHLIEECIRAQRIVTCSEIYEEIRDAQQQQWLNDNQCTVLPIDEEIQNNVSQILAEHPQLIDFKSGTSSGDAFLIATAMKYNLIIITEENKKSAKKIPHIADAMEVRAINIDDLCVEEGWQF